MMGEPDEPIPDAHSLVIPFVTVTSRGGPHDDASFVAGYEAGLIDARLAVGDRIGMNTYRTTVHTDLIRQHDLVAMHHGYTLTHEPAGVDGWSVATFTAGE